MIYHETEHGVLYYGDCLTVMKGLPDNSVDSIVTDPPYELGFMGKSWDNTGIAYNVDMWRECLRVLKPGGHLLSFGGSRTYHRMACAIEDAGFDVRDMIEWMYGSGFPKSLNIGNGYGTALKPAHEPICMARKPISEKTIAENVQRWGTGGINVDGCRVSTEDKLSFGSRELGDGVKYGKCKPTADGKQNPQGRFPANLIHDGSDEVLECFPETKSGYMNQQVKGRDACYTFGKEYDRHCETIGDSGSASRFFYCAKASKAERNAGLSDVAPRRDADRAKEDGSGGNNPRNRSNTLKQNHHPTVKPKALMQYLCRLITPSGGTVLDPFTGSGTTLCSAIREGFKYVGIEMQSEYCDIAKRRIEKELEQLRIEL